MTSWRDDLSQSAQDDLDGLLDFVLPFATEQLEKHGEFFPFGATVSSDGTMTAVMGDPDGSDQPLSQDVLDTLAAGMKAQAGDLRAVALVSDVRLSDSDAIRVQTEHREGAALSAFLPYVKARFRKTVTYGNLSASPGERLVFE